MNKKISISGQILDNGSAETSEKPVEMLIPREKAEIMTEPQPEAKDVNYWRSFKELYSNPDFLRTKKLEFQPGQLERPEVDKMSAFSRRKFLALMTASAAVAAAGCSNYKDRGEIIPYNKKPEEVTLGRPDFYASACDGCGAACGVLIRTREGRPIKVDGNPEHPVNKGKICSIGHASTMNLYQPDRLKNPMLSGKEIDWKDADDKIITALRSAASSGKEISILTTRVNSPSFKKVLDEFTAAYPSAKVYTYEQFNNSSKLSAWQKSYGNRNLPTIKFNEAKIILAIESDFLATESNKIENVRLFAEGRDVFSDKIFNRLYSVEGAVTQTGMKADYRLRLRADAMEDFVMSLLGEFISKKKVSAFASDTKYGTALSKYSLDEFAKKYNLDRKIIDHLVSDLEKNQGAAVVTGGESLPESTHIAINLLNEVIGGNKLYSSESIYDEVMPLSSRSDIDTLVSNLNSGKTGVIINADINPVYNLPADHNFAEALKKCPVKITITELPNETSALSDYVLPASNFMESWGDYKTRTNIITLQQPVINPLYNNRQKEAMLLSWSKGNKDAYTYNLYHEYVKANLEKDVYPSMKASVDFSRFWVAALHDGFIITNDKAKESSAYQGDSFVSSAGKNSTSSDFVLKFNAHHSIGDGKYANNAWLQELPHPISKIVWDNYAAVSVNTAKELGLKGEKDMISITAGAFKAEVPVFVQPGIAEKMIVLETGGGRTASGTIGMNVGVNVNKIFSNSGVTPYLYYNVKAEKTAGSYELVSTQEHHAVDDPVTKDLQFKRKIIREATYNEYKNNEEVLWEEEYVAGIPVEKFPSINQNNQFASSDVKWAMVIDMNKCTGCNDCTISCVVENNIPVVGKDQVKVNREMHWLRIDRYYSGTPDSPTASFQPMLCQHCDFAPCENVCPVAATTHSPDGINGMAYNRCVGTRYCANNCPYKVRRFNYFNWRDRVADGYFQQQPIDQMFNPEVTVRSRGVMEKCTFCVQRVMDAKMVASQEGRMVRGEDVTTACQDACNTNAISFGDMHNKESEFNRYRTHKLGYSVLDEIKVKPNITYIAQLRNVYEASEHPEGKNHVKKDAETKTINPEGNKEGLKDTIREEHKDYSKEPVKKF
ncbi:TAT-variant-translocated molybdopterin oxidoreductase [soil metagenome]